MVQSRMSSAGRPGWIVSGTKGSCVSLGDGVALKEYVNWQSYYRNSADHIHAGVPLTITPVLAKATIQCIHGCELAAKEKRLVEVAFDFG